MIIVVPDVNGRDGYAGQRGKEEEEEEDERRRR